ncbi:MAG: VOC family protein [Chloroflexi bacterium]|nr:VOC family protein [Chloroflexota bacterium]
MRLAKPHLDVGLFTTNEHAMMEFWQQEVGLPFSETLPLGGGVRQHRHEMNGSVLKLNAARDPLNDAPPSGYRELLIARVGIGRATPLVDPDGNRIVLLPPGEHGVTGIGVRMAARDAAAHARFYGEAMQMEQAGDGRFRCGDSVLIIEQDAGAMRTEPMRAPGYRYLTVQVWEVEAEHRGIIERGGEEGRPPVTLGATARVSFVRDPDGNWIEVSQRASLTGPLPSA